MIALLTSCGRPDLLKQTLDSLFFKQKNEVFVIVHEDNKDGELTLKSNYGGTIKINLTKGLGQHGSIEKFLNKYNGHEKYYLHLEDDWEFHNSYNWIKASIDIMERDPSIIKVLARFDSPHPCKHDHKFLWNEGKTESEKFGYIYPWTGSDYIKWHGFSWNPGVTRLDLLNKFIPFPKWEQDLAKNIYDAGYKVIELSKPIYKHIGDGRSTHE